MTPDQIKQLLGGYATGTLTPEEQKALFDAALSDQAVFDELARDQSLKELLDEPAVRRELLAELEPKPAWTTRLSSWLRWPYPVAAAGALAAAALSVVVLVRSGSNSHPAAPMRQQIARMENSQKEETASQPAPSQPAPSRPAASLPAASAPKAQRTESPKAPAALETPKPLADGRKLRRTEEYSVASNAIIAPAPQAAVAPPLVVETGSPLRSMIVVDQAAPGTSSSMARDLFYGTIAAAPPAVLPSGAAGGIAGGVVGGVPGAAMMDQARAKAARAPQQEASRVAQPPFGLRYSVRDAQSAPPRLVVEANLDSVLYLFQRSAGGAWVSVATGGQSLKAHTPVTTPEIPLDGNAPQPRTLLVLSRVPLAQLAQAGAELGVALDRLLTNNDPGRLLRQTTDGSTFLVLPGTIPSRVIVSPISIQ